MCHRTTCSTCKKVTWAGCGQHVDRALAGVPKERLCTCERGSAAPTSLLRQLFRGR